jgi:hypothetical protein
MSPAPVLSKARPVTDQRLHCRYPIRLELEYRVLNKGRAEQRGLGRTLDISSGGVLFEANDSLPVHSRIQLLLNWPFSSEGICPLKLLIRGHVVRSVDGAVAVRTERHEFRLAGVCSSNSRLSGEKVGSRMR